MESSGSVHFRTHLARETDIETLIARLDASKKTYDALERLAKELAAGEKSLGVSQRKAVRSVAHVPQLTRFSLASVTDGLRGALDRVAATADVSAADIERAVRAPLASSGKEYRQNAQQLHSEINGILNVRKQVHKSVATARREHEKATQARDNALAALEQEQANSQRAGYDPAPRRSGMLSGFFTSDNSPNLTEVQRLEQQYRNTTQRLHACEDAHVEAVSAAREKRRLIDEALRNALDKVEELESHRLQSLKQQLLTLVNTQRRAAQERVRILDTLYTQVQLLGPEEDCRAFCESASSACGDPPLPIFPEYRTHGNTGKSSGLLEQYEHFVTGATTLPSSPSPSPTPTPDALDSQFDNFLEAVLEPAKASDSRFNEMRQQVRQEDLSNSDTRSRLSAALTRVRRGSGRHFQVQAARASELVHLLLRQLDACAKTRDIRAASVLMIFTQTVFVLEGDRKCFLQGDIKHHALWKDLRFWEECFYDAYARELQKFPPTRRWLAPHEKRALTERDAYVLVAQLCAWTHNMREFDLSQSEVLAFASRACDLNNICGDKRDMVLLPLMTPDDAGTAHSTSSDIVETTDSTLPRENLPARAPPKAPPRPSRPVPLAPVPPKAPPRHTPTPPAMPPPGRPPKLAHS
ncbi:MAG: hypothetical protein MHM6MM_000103 [Cercozoa sp. M6MM]